MSDIGTTTNTGGDAGTVSSGQGLTTQTAPVTAAPVAPASTAPADIFAEAPSDQAVFDRGYVERIRREGQRYRDERAQIAGQLDEYNRVFGGYAPEDRQVWLELATTWASDPIAVAQQMEQIARAVLTPEGGETTPEGAGTPTAVGTSEAGAGTGEHLSPVQVQQMIAEAMREQTAQAQQAQEVENVYAEMRAGGFDPDTAEGFMVLWTASNQTGGDIHQAMDSMRQYRQGIVDSYVSGRANGHHPVPSPNGAVATAQEPIHDLRDARKAAQAFIDAQIGASAGQA